MKFKEFAYKAKRSRTHYSARDIVSRIRWGSDIETRGDSYKVNNNWSPFYARLLVLYDSGFEGFFAMRVRRV